MILQKLIDGGKTPEDIKTILKSHTGDMLWGDACEFWVRIAQKHPDCYELVRPYLESQS
jgi:hypothetical protein